MEHNSKNQEEKGKNVEGSDMTQKPNTKSTNNYSPEERRLTALFFTALEPHEHRKYSEFGSEIPSELGERLLNAFENFNESFRLFLKDLGYFEKEVVYDLILKLLADKINSISDGEIGTLTKQRYRGYFEYYYTQLEKLKPDVKFNLSWPKHNKYLLPLVVEAMCEKQIIAEPKRTALDAFQFIFPKEKLQQVNVESSIKSAFKADDPSVFTSALDALLNDIKDNLTKRQTEYRRVLEGSKKNKK